MDADFVFQPVHSLLAPLGARQLTASKMVECYLERIDDSSLGAFVAVYADEALDAARAADKAIAAGMRLGPLHGVPIVLKDLIEIEGRVTTGGSKHWMRRISSDTAIIVKRLAAAGMIVLGKTHTVEFAMGGFGTNRHMGTPWNPWDPDVHRAPGGSSSGTAVAVAAALTPWGLGTDTGGSVRVPSSWCGVAGLKTSAGRVSTQGVLPLSHTLDTVGPMCRDVEDCALLFGIVNDTPECMDDSSKFRSGVDGLVLARLPAPDRASVDEDVLAAYDESMRVLKGFGARVVELQLPLPFQEYAGRVARIIGAEGYFHVGHLVDDQTLPIDDDVRPRILLGRDMTAKDYLTLLRERELAKLDWNRALEGVDALLLPTTAEAAPRLTDIDQKRVSSPFTRPVNYVDWCALALPNGMTSGGLPTSLQIACRGGDEAIALRIGWTYEQATGWHRLRPRI